MNWLDLILLIPPLALLIRGVQKGIFKQVFSLGALVVALGLGVYANRSFIRDLWHDGNVEYFSANLISILIIILVSLILFLYLGSLLTKLFKGLHMGAITRVLGGLFGFVKGAIVSLLIAFVIQAISLHVPDWKTDVRERSLLLPYCKEINALGLELLLGNEEFDWRNVIPETDLIEYIDL
jgi:membrane protein required for colicin V production